MATADSDSDLEGAWARAADIRDRIEPPEFPDRECDVTEYGAVGDGETDCTEAFADAIADCTAAGGGRVVVPEGTYHTGAIHLDDDVELHVTDDATIAFSRDPDDYLPAVPTRYEGVGVINYSPFVYANGRENVAITGSGILDGRADEDHWWDWSGGDHPNEYDSKDRLHELIDDGVPAEERVFGGGDYLRPYLVEFYDCESVLVEGVTLTNSPIWHLHPVLCENVTVRGITVNTPRGSNTDGCNPESCTDVRVTDSRFVTGDDCLSFKAGKYPEGPGDDVPCRNAIVENCTMEDGNGGVVIGSETTGGVENIFARDCEMSSPNLKRALRMKTNPERDGYIRDIYFRDITAPEVGGSAIEIALNYANVDEGDHYPVVDDIHVENFRVEETGRVLYLVGNDDNPIRNVRLVDCTFEETRATDVIENVDRLVFENVQV